ncbi:class I SAM-dependent methyltransferase [Endozoicomonas arenosclerae]|uniref:class I SAM-dependent methyltransferase n=1 Tax=Endozoicomonas arenosclerae TaxID=1633495 RepID=UPI0007828761|nr:class I SAM-dependent methyltransferase [Endozoicomonas arenosclerae]
MAQSMEDFMSGKGLNMKAGTKSDQDAFIRRQEAVFSQAAEHFSSDEFISEALRKRLERLVDSGLGERGLKSGFRILDVGAGCGALTDVFLAKNPSADITAVDLSENMLKVLSSRYPSVKIVREDILKFSSPVDFDSVWFNACFGNLFDPAQVLRHISAQMTYGAKLHISHPMGRAFQKGLHRKYPDVVPHLLPANEEEAVKLVKGTGLVVEQMVDEKQLYLLSFRLA